MKVGIIIQARTGSTRLPRKVLLLVRKEQALILYLIDRIKQSKLADVVVLAISGYLKKSMVLQQIFEIEKQRSAWAVAGL